MPLSILTSATSADPMRFGGCIVLQQDLLASANVFTTVAGNESEAYQQGASEIVLTTLTGAPGSLHGQLILRGMAAQKNEAIVEADGSTFIGVLNELARQLEPQSIRFSTASDGALRSYTTALLQKDLKARVSGLRDTLQADPHFGLAYFALAENVQTDPAQVADIVVRAKANSAGFTELDRARMTAFTARSEKAPLGQQAQAQDQLVRLVPNDVDALALLGTERFLMGDGSGGEQALRRAVELAPTNENVRRELAAGLVAAKQFKAAEQQFAAMTNNANLLPELAACILLEGDTARADKVMDGYLESRRAGNDAAVTLIQANWLAVEGRTDEAIALLGSSTYQNPDLNAIAAGQKAVWLVASGKREQAKQAAGAAVRSAAGPQAKAYVAAGLLLALNSEKAIADAPVDAQLKATLSAYGSFLAGQYDAAADAWSRLVVASAGLDLRARAMLASSLEHKGAAQQAAKVQPLPFVPNVLGADPFAAISFHEMRRVLKIQ